MKPLLAYLVVRMDEGRWDVASYRDLDRLLGAWRDVGDPRAAAVVHVGFWRPDTAVFEDALAARPGTVLLTESAKTALPPSFRAASWPCAAAGGLRVFEALSGWGYEREESAPAPEHESAKNDPEPKLTASVIGLPDTHCRWLALAKTSEPSLWNSAAAAGIADDAEYIARERLLDCPERDVLAAFRFKCMTGAEPSEATILDDLACAPPWLLALDVKALNLSTRPTNRLAEKKLGSVADIARFGEALLMKIPNMGRRSVTEVARKILDAFSKGSAFCSSHAFISDATSQMPLFWSERSRSPLPEVQEDRDDGTSSFSAALEQTLEALEERERKILGLRMGLDGAPRTLEAIGETFNVTRERVRQIESKALGKVAVMMPLWRTRMEARLDHVLAGREEPLPLVGLDVMDPWFRGAAEMEEPFEYALEHFTREQQHWLLKIDGHVYVTGINEEAWVEAVRKAKVLLASQVEEDKALPESEAKWLAESLLVGRGEDLRPLLWKTATKWANFSAGPNGERLLASFGFGAENVVEAVLVESDRPLHYEEIAKRCAERGKPVDVRRAHNAAASVGVLMARGVYGLEKHIPLTQDERRTVLSEAENMLSENTSKQWHAAEIYDGLEERGLDFGGRLSKHIVNFVLEASKHLVYLGRMIWAARSTGSKGVADRIDVWQAMALMLEENGVPMRTEEIRSRLSRDRGLGETFQLHERDPVVRVGEGTWGLLWRDIPFSEKDATEIVTEMEEVMRSTGRGLHITEICAALRTTAHVASKADDPVLLVSLARRTGHMKADKGGYVYPSDWESSRRVCASAALSSALAEFGNDGATLTEIAARASALMGREIASSIASRMLITAGAVYDTGSMRWARSETDEPDPSEDVLREGYGEDLPPSEARAKSGAPAAQGV